MAHTVQEVKEHVQRQFGDDSGAQLLDTDYYRWVNEAQLEIFRRTEAGLLTPQTTPSIAGTSSYALPVTFLKAISVTFDGTILQKTSKKELDLRYPNRGSTPSGTPSTYSVDQNALILFPAPDRVANIVLEYHGRPTVVTALANSLTISDNYFTTLCRYCLAMAFQLDGNAAASSALMGEVQLRLGLDYHDQKDPYDDFYPFITYIPQEA